MRECGTIGSIRVEVKGALRPKRKRGQGGILWQCARVLLE